MRYYETPRQLAAIVLDTAATNMEKYGWCKGHLHKGQKSCAMGALQDAVGMEYIGPEKGTEDYYDEDENDTENWIIPFDVENRDEWCDAYNIAVGTLEKSTGQKRTYFDYSDSSLIEWNDAPSTRGREVISTFREVAKQLRK